MAESSTILTCRMVLGDEKTADLLFNQEYDADFVSRHTHQLGGIMQSKMENTK